MSNQDHALSPLSPDSAPVVIVGASHAAAEAVGALRRFGWKAGITVIGDEPYLPYQRPPLSKAYLKGDLPKERLEIRNAAFYDKQDAEFILGCRVTHIDRQAKQVQLDNGSTKAYSKLILATGTRARLLPIDAKDQGKLWYLRTIADVDRIRTELTESSRLLIVGAGYIGLEVAAATASIGLNVTVLEAQSRVLARVTGEDIAAYFTDKHRQQGVEISTGTQLQSAVWQEDHWRVVIKGETEERQYDHVLVGIGVLPNSELAHTAGLGCDNGILVNEYTQSSDPDIYAVGDCANQLSERYGQHLRLESVPNAVGQAKTAAMHICGKPQPYNDVPWFWSDQFDVKLQTAGLVQGYDQTVIRGDQRSGNFAVYYLKSGQLVAVDAVNSPPDFMVGKRLVAEQTVLTPEKILAVSNVKELLSPV